ncbi:MAG TPA: HAMP domain-containing histidine kinase [Firmicutes bacterium]|nr:HAMP domain-containing histidine kinase [Bacillota bacterium]
MSSIAKLTRRFVGILSLSTFLLLIVNFILLLVIASSQMPGAGPWTVARKTAEALRKTEDGYALSGEMARELDAENAWAVFIDDDTRQVAWHTENLPAEIPMAYTLSEISGLTRGYLADYPTFTGSAENGLVVVGFPKDRYWKHMNPAWDYDLIQNSPYILLAVIGVNVAVIFLIYVAANSRLLRSVKPIANGVQALPTQEPVYVRERGLLSDLARDINRTAEILQAQRAGLRKRETARADWISGVSHDIRTPLSMVMGYAGQLEEEPGLSEENRRKVSIIRQQSLKMKSLVNDLNLASKLEYDMQPLHPQPVNLVAVARQCAADFINADFSEIYPLEWNTAGSPAGCVINGDRDLLCRAVVNLLNNVRSHNPDGCRIFVEVRTEGGEACVAVEDDGAGITDEQLRKLRDAPHYRLSDYGTEEPCHGLGLRIVRQIVKAHHGSVDFDHGASGGFLATMRFPLRAGAGPVGRDPENPERQADGPPRP